MRLCRIGRRLSGKPFFDRLPPQRIATGRMDAGETPALLEVWPKSGRKGLSSWQSMMGESGHAGRAI